MSKGALSGLGLLLLMFPLLTSAQQLGITRIDLQQGVLMVHYELNDANASNEYKVDLYCSKDNFAQPLTKVKGDVGTDIKPGADHIIQWSILQELGTLAGELSVEVRARVYIPFLKVASVEAGRKFRRGKSYPLVWTSGNLGGQVDVDLFDGNDRVKSDRNIPNVGKYDWYIDGSVKSGKNYHLRFTNTRNRDEFVDSSVFTIVPRTPLAVKLLGLAAVGGGIVIISNLGGTPPPDATNPLEEFSGGLPQTTE